jgi:hypothetical protein
MTTSAGQAERTKSVEWCIDAGAVRREGAEAHRYHDADDQR